MKAIITGGAGFIGSNLADFLLEKGWEIKVIDNLSTGHKEFYEHNLENPKYSFEELDLKDADGVIKAFEGDFDVVFHLAANADVKGGADNPTYDLGESVHPMSNVLEGMRINGIKKIVFSSTGSIYGEQKTFPIPEDAPFPIQTSMYGAAKLYAEGLIQAYCEAYDMQCWIYRFVSVLGERYTHGVIFSFYQQLLDNPDHLEFLSDGSPLKSYMYVGDCIRGIYLGLTESDEKVNIFNLGTDEEITVKDIAKIVEKKLDVSPEHKYGPNPGGWIGDVPHIFLDTKRMRDLGWEMELTIQEAIERTVEYLKDNKWCLGEKYFREKK